MKIRVLHPSAWFPYLGNEASCVLRIETAHGNALLTGDIGPPGRGENSFATIQPRSATRSCWSRTTAAPAHRARTSLRPPVRGWRWVSSGAGNRVRPSARACGAALVRAGAGGHRYRPQRRDPHLDGGGRPAIAGAPVLARARLWDAARRRNGRLGYATRRRCSGHEGRRIDACWN